MTRIYETTGGRRFLLTVASQALSAWLLWAGKLTADAYSMIVLGTVGAYIVGNTYQKVKTGSGE